MSCQVLCCVQKTCPLVIVLYNCNQLQDHTPFDVIQLNSEGISKFLEIAVMDCEALYGEIESVNLFFEKHSR